MEIKAVVYVVLMFCLLGISECLNGRGGTPDGSEEWGYVPVRPGASMFYWFYKTTHPDGHLNRPIVLWLQGGPGLAGSGLGNFLMFGPLDQNLQPRNSTWIQTVNVLIVDNPAGTGFSVVDNVTDIPTDIEAISIDVVLTLQVFMREHSSYKSSPFYIFGQSYGGKMAAALAYYLNQAIKQKEIKCNLKGVGIGNGFVSLTDIILNYPPMLFQMSVIDDVQFQNLSSITSEAWEAGEAGQWADVLGAFFNFFAAVGRFVPTLNLYNIIKPYEVNPGRSQRAPRSIYDIDLTEFMDTTIKDKLGIIPEERSWIDGYDTVYPAQFVTNDLVKPVFGLVDDLLKNSDVKIFIYQGQLDVICDTVGVLKWMQRLTWPGKVNFDNAERKVLANEETRNPEMYVKSYGNLKMYWVLNSGHVVPTDVPEVGLKMLNRILDDVD